MPIIITSLLSFLGSLLGRFFTDTALKWVAQKALLYSLLTLILPIVIKNIFTWFFTEMSQVVDATTSGSSLDAVLVTLTGNGAWLAQALMVPDCLSVILTAVAIRLTLNFIPFIG